MITFTQYYLKVVRPRIMAWLTRILYSGSRIRIGKKFRTDSIPRLIVDKGSQLTIGDHVEFRRNIEIRAHGMSHVSIGNKVRLDRGIRILAANKSLVTLEEGVRVGLYTVLNGGDSISVGCKSLISGFVYLQTSMHGFSKKTMAVQDQGYQHAPVVLEEDVWLGTHVVVMPGINIKKGAVVGSNAVVNKDVESFQVVAGITAKPINNRQ